ncbi:uncharacterized protein [Venturia canescens]|nr:uncharacterized protein LOC122414994 isoform X3 [Venturia canescens]
MATMSTTGFTILHLLTLATFQVHGHGRLMDPPARNSMWRFGFPNPVNWNDNELYCGGYSVQWSQNDGKCGLCGDAYHLKDPRPHEAGGMYAKGTIVRHYVAGQDIDIEVELTANHQGRFELHICPNNNPAREATQECLDRFPLYLSGTQNSSFVIPPEVGRQGIFNYKVSLPPGLTCTQCVIQWDYYTGNMWGTCPDGTERVGCGRPETFRNCADVSITTSTGGRPPSYVLQSLRQLPTFIKPQVCVPTNTSRRIPAMAEWCQVNCLRNPSNCPEEFCHCPETCDAIGEIAGQEGADVYCLDKCIVYPSDCPSNRCTCY